jgi:uncharacterized Fe-S cluster protein YjdI
MRKLTKKYSNGEITVVWKPHICIHSGICFRELPQVFNPNRVPWVDQNAAETGVIIHQVSMCPSGALSYFRNTEAEKSGK